MADGGVSLHLGRQQVSPPLIDEQKKKRINMRIHVGIHTHTHTQTHPPPQPNHRKGNHWLHCRAFGILGEVQSLNHWTDRESLDFTFANVNYVQVI